MITKLVQGLLDNEYFVTVFHKLNELIKVADKTAAAAYAKQDEVHTDQDNIIKLVDQEFELWKKKFELEKEGSVDVAKYEDKINALKKERTALTAQMETNRSELEKLINDSKEKRDIIVNFVNQYPDAIDQQKAKDETAKKKLIDLKYQEEQFRRKYYTERLDAKIAAIAAFGDRTSVLYCAARVAFGLFFNYMSDGTINMMNADVWFLLIKSPFLCPFLYPTGSGDESFYNSKFNNANKFWEFMKSNIDAYISGNLKKYITNVYATYKNMQGETGSEMPSDSIKKMCNDLILSINSNMSDLQFINSVNRVLLNHEHWDMKWKMLSQDANKGVCSAKVTFVPSSYPVLCPDLELCEGLTIVLNRIIEKYSSPKEAGDINAGMCFMLPHTDVSFKGIWDNKFAEPTQTAYENEDGKSKTEKYKTYPELAPYKVKKEGTSITETESEVGDMTSSSVWVNPTKFISDRYFLNKNIINKCPSLSAVMTESFRKNILEMIRLKLDAETEDNPFKHVNKSIMTSLDYIRYNPTGWSKMRFGFDSQEHLIKLIVGQLLVSDSFSWHLIFPIPNMVVANTINTRLILDGFTINGLPQQMLDTENSIKGDKVSVRMPDVILPSVKINGFKIYDAKTGKLIDASYNTETNKFLNGTLKEIS